MSGDDAQVATLRIITGNFTVGFAVGVLAEGDEG